MSLSWCCFSFRLAARLIHRQLQCTVFTCMVPSTRAGWRLISTGAEYSFTKRKCADLDYGRTLIRKAKTMNLSSVEWACL
jgi:hypothetical protein